MFSILSWHPNSVVSLKWALDGICLGAHLFSPHYKVESISGRWYLPNNLFCKSSKYICFEKVAIFLVLEKLCKSTSNQKLEANLQILLIPFLCFKFGVNVLLFDTNRNKVTLKDYSLYLVWSMDNKSRSEYSDSSGKRIKIVGKNLKALKQFGHLKSLPAGGIHYHFS